VGNGPMHTKRRHRSATIALAVLAAALLCGADFDGTTEEDHVVVNATQAAAQGAPTAGVTQSTRIEEWVRAPLCGASGYRHDISLGCYSPALEVTVLCPDGTEALPPWWMRYRLSSGAWSNWLMVGYYQCPAEMLRAAVENAWARMYITPNTINVQPDTGWVLTTVPTIVYVDRNPRTMNTTLLSTPVIIRARASAYTWTWGDGSSPTVTTKPGAAYPNSTVNHTYMHHEGPVTIRLTTSWTGSYSTNGGATWQAAPGTAHTTSTPVTVTVYDPHGHRVDCTLDGTCVSGADGPSET